MSFPFETVSLGESIAIQVRYFLGATHDAKGCKILVIKYEGTCRSGKIGEPDGRFMLAMGKAGLIAWEPDGLVLDLADLECSERVDGLTSLLCLGEGEFGSENLPQAIVVGPRSESVIQTYFHDIDDRCSAETKEEYFHDVETAIEVLEEEMNKLYILFFGEGRSPETSR